MKLINFTLLVTTAVLLSDETHAQNPELNPIIAKYDDQIMRNFYRPVIHTLVYGPLSNLACSMKLWEFGMLLDLYIGFLPAIFGDTHETALEALRGPGSEKMVDNCKALVSKVSEFQWHTVGLPIFLQEQW